MGWLIGDFPRMISVQSEGCDPITRAFEAGKFVSEFFDNAQTVAAGLRVPKAFGDTLILEALQASGGKAVSVPDEEILNSMTELARGEGLIVCPEGAATWSALKKLRDAGDIDPNERVVLFNTGLGLKYPEVLAQLTKNEV